MNWVFLLLNNLEVVVWFTKVTMARNSMMGNGEPGQTKAGCEQDIDAESKIRIDLQGKAGLAVLQKQ